MSFISSTYHIPFPTNFLTVNTPVKKQSDSGVQSPAESVVPAHGFLSNRPVSARHQSISSVSSITSVAAPPSETSIISAPSSPATKAADSPIFGPKIFAPLAVNSKHALPPSTCTEMSNAERQRRMSFEKHTFLSNKH